MNNIYSGDLVRAFPSALQNDKRLHTLAMIAAKYIQATIRETDVATIYANIDELPEVVLDIIAYDFKVDWWNYDYTLEEKRRTLKDSFNVHRHLGTKYAVETAISAIYPNTTVQEWFEYGGEPYHFRLSIDTTGIDITSAMFTEAIRRIIYYKNVRSHPDQITYITQMGEQTVRFGGAMSVMVKMPIPQIADEIRFEGVLHGGSGGVSAQITRPIPQVPDDLHFESVLHSGASMTAQVTRPVPQIPDEMHMTHAERTGVQGAVSHTVPLPEITE